MNPQPQTIPALPTSVIDFLARNRNRTSNDQMRPDLPGRAQVSAAPLQAIPNSPQQQRSGHPATFTPDARYHSAHTVQAAYPHGYPTPPSHTSALSSPIHPSHVHPDAQPQPQPISANPQRTPSTSFPPSESSNASFTQASSGGRPVSFYPTPPARQTPLVSPDQTRAPSYRAMIAPLAQPPMAALRPPTASSSQRSDPSPERRPPPLLALSIPSAGYPPPGSTPTSSQVPTPPPQAHGPRVGPHPPRRRSEPHVGPHLPPPPSLPTASASPTAYSPHGYPPNSNSKRLNLSASASSSSSQPIPAPPPPLPPPPHSHQHSNPPLHPPPRPSQPHPRSEVDRLAHTHYLEARVSWLLGALAESEAARGQLADDQTQKADTIRDLTRRLYMAQEDSARAIKANERLAAEVRRVGRERNEAMAELETRGREVQALRGELQVVRAESAHRMQAAAEEHTRAELGARRIKKLEDMLTTFMQRANVRVAELERERNQLAARLSSADTKGDPGAEEVKIKPEPDSGPELDLAPKMEALDDLELQYPPTPAPVASTSTLPTPADASTSEASTSGSSFLTWDPPPEPSEADHRPSRKRRREEYEAADSEAIANTDSEGIVDMNVDVDTGDSDAAMEPSMGPDYPMLRGLGVDVKALNSPIRWFIEIRRQAVEG
ncbi:hypothetical protein B0H11DRAFT_1303326 [Mycena galericulata]|nr:hypothetical protein B0H11DRAFT_1303326 [Mycena galericulata]